MNAAVDGAYDDGQLERIREYSTGILGHQLSLDQLVAVSDELYAEYCASMARALQPSSSAICCPLIDDMVVAKLNEWYLFRSYVDRRRQVVKQRNEVAITDALIRILNGVGVTTEDFLQHVIENIDIRERYHGQVIQKEFIRSMTRLPTEQRQKCAKAFFDWSNENKHLL